jgi:uncharacterized membrane protein YccC
MDYIKEYKKFVTGHYLSSGVRIMAGIVLPAIVLNYFNLLGAGIVVSLGAMCASTPDSPGPIIDRRNAMAACIITTAAVAVLTGIASAHPLLLGIFIFVFCFIFFYDRRVWRACKFHWNSRFACNGTEYGQTHAR